MSNEMSGWSLGYVFEPELTGFGGPRNSSVDRMELSGAEILEHAILHNWDECHSNTDTARIEAHRIMRGLVESFTPAVY